MNTFKKSNVLEHIWKNGHKVPLIFGQSFKFPFDSINKGFLHNSKFSEMNCYAMNYYDSFCLKFKNVDVSSTLL